MITTKSVVGVVGLYNSKPSSSWSQAMLYSSNNVGNYVWMYGVKNLIHHDYHELKGVEWGAPSSYKTAPLVVGTANILHGLRTGEKWPATLKAGGMLEEQLRNHNGSSVILGIGGSFANTNNDLTDEDFLPHPNISKLLNTITRKGVLVSVRGPSTSKMFKHEKTPHVVLGCPSLMISREPNLGALIETRTMTLRAREDMVIVFTLPHYVHTPWLKVTLHWIQQYPSSFYVMQSGSDIKNENRLRELLDEQGIEPTEFLKGRVRFFSNIEDWQTNVCLADMAISIRIHGSMMPIVCGIPTLVLVVTPDERVRELASVMFLPNISLETFEQMISGNKTISDPVTYLKQFPMNGSQFDANRAKVARAYVGILDNVGIHASPHVKFLATGLLP